MVLKKRVALATFFRHYFFRIASVNLLQNLRLRQKLIFYYFYLNFIPLAPRKSYFWKMWNTKKNKPSLTA